MRPGRRQLFIYWRVASADVAAALRATPAVQAQLRLNHQTLRTGLYQHTEASAGEATLMETYALASQAACNGIDAAMQQRIEAASAEALQPWLRGVRHVEVFDACDD
jgi:Domain of unknown function (DUF4936)